MLTKLSSGWIVFGSMTHLNFRRSLIRQSSKRRLDILVRQPCDGKNAQECPSCASTKFQQRTIRFGSHVSASDSRSGGVPPVSQTKSIRQSDRLCSPGFKFSSIGLGRDVHLLSYALQSSLKTLAKTLSRFVQLCGNLLPRLPRAATIGDGQFVL